MHADLYEVDVTAKIKLRVPLHFVGRAEGVELGGILQPIRREVEVLCLPTEIPDYLEIDVTRLGIHDAVHISDLKAPPGVEIPFDTDEALVTVLPPVVEEVKVAPEAEAVEGAPAAAAPAEGCRQAGDAQSGLVDRVHVGHRGPWQSGRGLCGHSPQRRLHGRRDRRHGAGASPCAATAGALRVGPRTHRRSRPSCLAEPQTFMNRSGEALARGSSASPMTHLLVVHDDLDLPSGQIRVRRRGGSGGHRGVASIVAHLGPEFARVRVGIGRPPDGRDAAEHVLEPLSAAELIAMRADVERASDAVECVVTDGPDAAMSRFNGRALPATD